MTTPPSRVFIKLTFCCLFFRRRFFAGGMVPLTSSCDCGPGRAGGYMLPQPHVIRFPFDDYPSSPPCAWRRRTGKTARGVSPPGVLPLHPVEGSKHERRDG